MPDAKRTPPTPGPWEIVGDRPPVITADWAPIAAVDCSPEGFRANARLLAAAPDFLAACTRETGCVSALDWLAAVLTVVDARFGALAGDDPQALHTALQASSALLAELRAAVARAEGGGDE